MRNKIGSLFLIFLFIAGIQIDTMGQGTPVITNHLSQQMENTAAGDMIRINITLAERIETFAGVEIPNPSTDGLLPVVLNTYRRMEPRVRDAGHGIKMVAARGPLTVATHLMGVGNFLLALKLQPAETHALLKVTTTLVRTWLEAQAEVLSDVEGIMVLDDIAGFVSPKDYLEFAHPYLAEIFSAFPRAVKVFHNDTDNPVSYKYLAELGVHIFNFTHLKPIEKVRDLVGPKICLMGNVSPLEVLAQGTPDQVRAETRRCLDAHPGRAGLLLSAGGGISRTGGG